MSGSVLGDASEEFALAMSMDAALSLAADYALPEVDEPAGGWLDEPLVEVRSVDGLLRVDVRYATADNFMGVAVYDSAVAALRRGVAEDLAAVHADLVEAGYGLVVYDAYRPYAVSVAMWLATPEALREQFVAPPCRGSLHNRGGAVDVGLVHRETGEIAAMPSAFDEFSERAAVGYAGGPSDRLERREVLIAAMARRGFAVYAGEWWHFNHRDARRYRPENVPLSGLAGVG